MKRKRIQATFKNYFPIYPREKHRKKECITMSTECFTQSIMSCHRWQFKLNDHRQRHQLMNRRRSKYAYVDFCERFIKTKQKGLFIIRENITNYEYLFDVVENL